MAAISSLALVIAGVFLWLQLQRSQQNLFDSLLGLNRPDFRRIEVLSDQLEKAHKYRKAANLQRNEDDIKRAIAAYQTVRAETAKLLYDIEKVYEENDPNVKNLVQKKPEFEELFKESGSSLAEMIETYRIPLLKDDLSKARKTGNFGILIPNTPLVALEKQYPPGPVRTTYELIMRELGAKADENRDGQIGGKAEADQIPCETLKKIQELWRQATENRCDWYDPKATSFDVSTTDKIPDCHELGRVSLTESIFWSNTYFPIQRLKHCKIVPQGLEP